MAQLPADWLLFPVPVPSGHWQTQSDRAASCRWCGPLRYGLIAVLLDRGGVGRALLCRTRIQARVPSRPRVRMCRICRGFFAAGSDHGGVAFRRPGRPSYARPPTLILLARAPPRPRRGDRGASRCEGGPGEPPNIVSAGPGPLVPPNGRGPRRRARGPCSARSGVGCVVRSGACDARWSSAGAGFVCPRIPPSWPTAAEFVRTPRGCEASAVPGRGVCPAAR